MMTWIQLQGLLVSMILALLGNFPVVRGATEAPANDGGIFWCYIMPAIMGLGIISIFGCMIAACLSMSGDEDEDDDKKKE